MCVFVCDDVQIGTVTPIPQEESTSAASCQRERDKNSTTLVCVETAAATTAAATAATAAATFGTVGLGKGAGRGNPRGSREQQDFVFVLQSLRASYLVFLFAN